MGKFCFFKTTSHSHYHTMFNEGGRYFNFTFFKRPDDGTWFWYIYLGGKHWVSD